MNKKFENYGAFEANDNWKMLTERPEPIYGRADDIRSPFGRDYTRILHSLAFRRLRHKTQVFFNAGDNDHICTRIEHVLHVESVSSTIADYLGLNSELTKAISMAHDLGHAPFGHQGESILNDITMEYLGESFWHERNGLYFVDNVELLEDDRRRLRPLDLTYAVRDGIISHCGEVDVNALRPRSELMDLYDFKEPGQYEAATWEGCVVKIADKIAYLGRDIEDAGRLGILEESKLEELLSAELFNRANALNTTVIMHNAIIDLCRESSPEEGLKFSDEVFAQLTAIKDFNYKNIYLHPELIKMKKNARKQLEGMFLGLSKLYNGAETINMLDSESKRLGSAVLSDFADWLSHYVDEGILTESHRKGAALCLNKKIYGKLEHEKIFYRAVIDYIAGMTDSFAEKAYEELEKIC